MKTTKEMIEVMRAYDEGKTIQCTHRSYETWGDVISLPTWNWDKYDFRIKSEPKTRPMTFKEIVDYWKKHRTEIYTIHHDDIGKKNEESYILSVDYEDESFKIGKRVYSTITMYRCVTKEDGSNFEVEEE